MIKKMLDKINVQIFGGIASIILIGVLVAATIHAINAIIAVAILFGVTAFAAVILSIKAHFEAKKIQKAQDSAYLALKNKTIQELAELATLDAGEAAAYSKLQNVTLFDLFAIAKRAEEANRGK
jgi:predicted lipid-binding transport protein (Tim44 family)